MKCILCESRKAKRYCPAKKRFICAVCCGEKRGVEINCPSDCPYYVEGQKYHQEKVVKQRLRKEGADSYVKRAELYKKDPQVFAKIEIAIANIFRANNKLKNNDLAEGLALSLKTLETEKRGLIYDYRSDNTYANEISRLVIKIIREYVDSVDIVGHRISIRLAAEIVQEFLKEVNFYIENESNPRSYLIHILRYHPMQPGSHQDSELIITS